LYSDARSNALKELYKHKELSKSRSESIEADFEEVAASCGHFSFSIYDFGTEMQTFLAILEDLKDETEIKRSRSWKWLRFWPRSKYKGRFRDDPEQEPLMGETRHDSSAKDLPHLIMERQNFKQWDAMVLEDQAKRGFYRRTLRLLRVLERDDCKWSSAHIFHRLTAYQCVLR
jgi:hypothetical protein